MKKKKIFLWLAIILIAIHGYFQIISSNTIILNHEVFINNTPEKVWQVLNDIEAVEKYNPQVAIATCISTSKEGVNSSRECKMKDSSSVKEKITLIEPNKAITMELYESSWPVQNMQWRTAIEPKENGTLVTQKLECKVKYGAFDAILNTLMMKNKMDASLKEVFAGLKKYSETK